MAGIKVDLSGVRAKVNPQAFKRGRYALTNQMIADMNQFVPRKDGNLRQAVSINIDGSAINYNQPYAKAQFYGFVGNPAHRVYHYSEPGTSRRWDLRAKARYMKVWEDAFLKGAGIN